MAQGVEVRQALSLPLKLALFDGERGLIALLDPVITRPAWTSVVFEHHGLAEAMNGVLAGGTSRGVEHPVLCKDASRRWVLWNAQRLPEYDQDGRGKVVDVGPLGQPTKGRPVPPGQGVAERVPPRGVRVGRPGDPGYAVPPSRVFFLHGPVVQGS